MRKAMDQSPILDLDLYCGSPWWRFIPLLSEKMIRRLCTKHLPTLSGKVEKAHEEFKKLVKDRFRGITGLDIEKYLEDLSLDRSKMENPKDNRSMLKQIFKLKKFKKQYLEANISHAFVEPILEKILGWVHGKSYVVQVGQTGLADIMLNHSTENIRIPIEVEPPLCFRTLFKKTNGNKTGLSQLEKYILDEIQRGNEIDYGILTDGFNWILYKWRNDGKFDGHPVLIFSFKNIYQNLEAFKVFYLTFHAKTWSDVKKLYVNK